MSPLEYASRIAYSSKEVLQFSYDMARKYKDIPNTCMVEAGVAAGAQIIAMIAGSDKNVTIYALDSFMGLPRPSNKDDQMPGIKFLSKQEQLALPNPGEQLLESTGAVSVSEGDFWHNIDTAFGPMKHNVKTVKGWFEETLPTFECEPISILRLDGDLYNSTYVCLKYLYPKVIEGGIVIIDDWALPGCKWAVIEYMGEMGENPNYQVIEGNNSQMCYWYK